MYCLHAVPNVVRPVCGLSKMSTAMRNQSSVIDDEAPLPIDGEPVFLLKRMRPDAFAATVSTSQWFLNAELPPSVQTVPARAFVPEVSVPDGIDVPVVPSSRRGRRIAAKVVGLLAIVGAMVFLFQLGRRTSARTELLRWGTMGHGLSHGR